MFFSEPCNEIKCGVDAEKIENKAKPTECTCICPDEAKGDPFYKCDGEQTNLLENLEKPEPCSNDI